MSEEMQEKLQHVADLVVEILKLISSSDVDTRLKAASKTVRCPFCDQESSTVFAMKWGEEGSDIVFSLTCPECSEQLALVKSDGGKPSVYINKG